MLLSVGLVGRNAVFGFTCSFYDEPTSSGDTHSLTEAFCTVLVVDRPVFLVAQHVVGLPDVLENLRRFRLRVPCIVSEGGH